MDFIRHRSWMYNRIGPNRRGLTDEFISGVNEFVQHACTLLKYQNEGVIRCPCRKCKSGKMFGPEDVVVHLYKNGFKPKYWWWIDHGEVEPPNFDSIYATYLHEQRNIARTDNAESSRYHDMIRDAAKIDLFLIGHKKKSPKTGERDQWVDSRAEATYNAFQSLAAEERLNQTEATDDSTARTQNLPRSDEELFTQAAGGVYKGRVYRMGNQPSTNRSVYSASPSTFVSRAEYDLMRHRVAELTEEVSTGQQQMTELIQSLQAKIEKMEKRKKNKRKTSNNEDTDSSTD